MSSTRDNMKKAFSNLAETKKAAAKLREQKRKQENDIVNLQSGFIEECIDDFCEKMLIPNNLESYTHGAYTCDLTKYVNRMGLVVNEDHNAAMVKFRDAFEDMNRIFATYASNYPKAFKSRILASEKVQLKNMP